MSNQPTAYIVKLADKHQPFISTTVTASSPEEAVEKALEDPQMRDQFGDIPDFQYVRRADADENSRSLVGTSRGKRLARRILQTIGQYPEPLIVSDILAALSSIEDEIQRLARGTPINKTLDIFHLR